MPKTIVVKVGTSTLADAEGRIDRAFLDRLADQLCALADEGRRVVLVSSGAVRAGAEVLGWETRPRTLSLKQAAAAVGQGRLMGLYAESFGRHGRAVGQVLLTRQLAQDRPRYVNAQNTLKALLDHGAIPIINENDAIAVEELQFGDNDTLAALTAALVGAKLLILLTNVEGLLDQNKRLIPQVKQLTPELREMAGGAGKHGSGGMATKLQAAEIAGAAGVRTVIARGRRENVIPEIVHGAHHGTTLIPPEKQLSGRKHWLAYGTQPRGSVTVNACAVAALVEQHRSLLPVGITAVEGPFEAGETVSIRDEKGRELGRGITSCDWRDVQRLIGVHSSRIPALLGREDLSEIIHRDNLVVLRSHEAASGEAQPL